MTNKPKNIGTAGESAALKVFQKHFPDAERRALKGGLDQGDLCGIPGLVVEVKAGHAAETASDHQIELWLDETYTEKVNAKAQCAVLVVKRKGIGPANAHRWWAIERVTGECDIPRTHYSYLGQWIEDYAMFLQLLPRDVS